MLRDNDQKRKYFLMGKYVNQNFYNASDFELNFLQRVKFWRKFFLRSMILQKKIFLKSTILKKKIFLKKHDFEEKIIFKKQILRKKIAHKKSRFGSIYTG